MKLQLGIPSRKKLQLHEKIQPGLKYNNLEFICSFSVFAFTWSSFTSISLPILYINLITNPLHQSHYQSFTSISLKSSKSLHGFSLTEAGRNTSGSSSYISARLFLTLSYNLTLSALESQFRNSKELLNTRKHFIRLIRSTVHLNRACEVAIFIFFKK